MTETKNRNTLTKLLLSIQDNSIVCASHLVPGFASHDNLKNYVKNGFLDSVGRGAYCKHGNSPTIAAAVAALTCQLHLPVHIGGHSALARHGLLHFLPAAELPASIYCPAKIRIPAWMLQAFAGKFTCTKSNFLPPDMAVETTMIDGFRVPLSSPERAILEYLFRVPEKHEANEAFQILELMANARPHVFSQLLESCTSVKVKRLFLLLAEDANHQWFEDISLQNVSLGSGNRCIGSGGTYRPKWLLTVKDWRNV